MEQSILPLLLVSFRKIFIQSPWSVLAKPFSGFVLNIDSQINAAKHLW